MKKIFSIEKYAKKMALAGRSIGDWAKQCIGREVIDGVCKGADGHNYVISNDWCIEKYEVGDRVVAIEPNGNKFVAGKVGTVIGIVSDSVYMVEFDENIQGHSGLLGMYGKDGSCWCLEYSQIQLAKEPKFKVVFSGDTTTLFKEGKKYATARCQAGDTYDREKGLLVCLAKANGINFKELREMLDRAETQNKTNEVARKAKVGEYIKIVDPQATNGCYKKGDILKVYKVAAYCGGVFCEMKIKVAKNLRHYVKNHRGNIAIMSNEYVVLEGYKPYKITLSEFWAQKGKKELAIHCKTEGEAKELLKAFDRVGQKWDSGDSYLNETEWEIYKKDTIYYNDNTYESTTYAEYTGDTVYEFNEVDLDN